MTEFSVAVDTKLVKDLTEFESSSPTAEYSPLVGSQSLGKLEIYLSPTDNVSNLKCLLVAESCRVQLSAGKGPGKLFAAVFEIHNMTFIG